MTKKNSFGSKHVNVPKSNNNNDSVVLIGCLPTSSSLYNANIIKYIYNLKINNENNKLLVITNDTGLIKEPG
jgi:hypothetical protein